MSNIVQVKYSKTRHSVTRALYQYDYGQVLVLDEGFIFEDTYEVHFSNKESDEDVIVVTGDINGVAIPDECFQSGNDIEAWIYYHDGESDGESVYKITIPVVRRAHYTKPDISGGE